MSADALLFGLIVAGFFLHRSRINELEGRMTRMQHDIGLLERQVASLRRESHVHHYRGNHSQ